MIASKMTKRNKNLEHHESNITIRIHVFISYAYASAHCSKNTSGTPQIILNFDIWKQDKQGYITATGGNQPKQNFDHRTIDL